MLRELCKIIPFMSLNFLIKEIPAFFCRPSPWEAGGRLRVLCPAGILTRRSASGHSALVGTISSVVATGFQSFYFCSTPYVSKGTYSTLLTSPSYAIVSSPHSLNCSETTNSHREGSKFSSLVFLRSPGTAEARPVLIQGLFTCNEDLLASSCNSLRRYDL